MARIRAWCSEAFRRTTLIDPQASHLNHKVASGLASRPRVERINRRVRDRMLSFSPRQLAFGTFWPNKLRAMYR